VRGATQQSLAKAYQGAARLDKQQSLIEADDGAATEQAKVASSAKPQLSAPTIVREVNSSAMSMDA
jgi:hypothetical protein